MTFAWRCWNASPAWFPCDVDASAEAVVLVSVTFVIGLVTLGFFAALVALVKHKT